MSLFACPCCYHEPRIIDPANKDARKYRPLTDEELSKHEENLSIQFHRELRKVNEKDTTVAVRNLPHTADDLVFNEAIGEWIPYWDDERIEAAVRAGYAVRRSKP